MAFISVNLRQDGVSLSLSIDPDSARQFGTLFAEQIDAGATEIDMELSGKHTLMFWKAQLVNIQFSAMDQRSLADRWKKDKLTPVNTEIYCQLIRDARYLGFYRTTELMHMFWGDERFAEKVSKEESFGPEMCAGCLTEEDLNALIQSLKNRPGKPVMNAFASTVYSAAIRRWIIRNDNRIPPSLNRDALTWMKLQGFPMKQLRTQWRDGIPNDQTDLFFDGMTADMYLDFLFKASQWPRILKNGKDRDVFSFLVREWPQMALSEIRKLHVGPETIPEHILVRLVEDLVHHHPKIGSDIFWDPDWSTVLMQWVIANGNHIPKALTRLAFNGKSMQGKLLTKAGMKRIAEQMYSMVQTDRDGQIPPEFASVFFKGPHMKYNNDKLFDQMVAKENLKISETREDALKHAHEDPEARL